MGRPAEGQTTGRAPAAGIGILLLAVAYALLGYVGRRLEFAPAELSPMWPAAGVGVAAMLLWGRWLWPGIFLGSLAANLHHLVVTTGEWRIATVAALGIAAGATLSAVLATVLVRRSVAERVPLHSVRDLVWFVFDAALLAPLVNAAIGTAAFRATGLLPADELAPAAVSWWLGDVVGILVVAPPLLLLGERHRVVPRRQPGEALLALLVLAVCAGVAFGPWFPFAREFPLSHIALPAMVWLSLRFGLAGATAGNVIVAVVAILGTVAARGPFARPDIGESLRMLQLFVAVVSTTFLALSTTLEERVAVQRELELARGHLEESVAQRTRALRRSLALLRATLDATADGILVVDLAGRIVSYNDRFLELWRMPRDIVAASRDELVLERSLAAVESPDAFLARVKEVYARPDLDSEDTIVMRDGRVIERYSRPQWMDHTPAGRVWSFRDVTARVLAERERDRLLVQEQHARHEAEAAHARTAFLADAGRSLAHSISYPTTLRRVAALAVSAGGQSAALYLVDGGLAEVAAAQVDGTVQGWVLEEDGGEAPGPDVRAEVEQTLAAGEIRQWTDTAETGPLICLPLFSRGRTTGVLAIAREKGAPPFRPEDTWVLAGLADRGAIAVENARLFREVQEGVRVRDDFLSIASHELKTPLTTLKLQLQKMQRIVVRDASDPRVPQMLDSVVRQSARLHALIDSLLDISRITTHGISLEREPVDLAAVAGEAIDRLREDAARAGTALHLDVAGDPHGFWDRLRVEQVVGNLVSNAIKYGGGRPVDVRVDGTGDPVRVEVEDRGIGISEEDQKRIFDRFERAVASRHFGGFGLGLWIVRQVVEALGGRISVRSRAGAGSVFTVELPRAMPEAHAREDALPR